MSEFQIIYPLAPEDVDRYRGSIVELFRDPDQGQEEVCDPFAEQLENEHVAIAVDEEGGLVGAISFDPGRERESSVDASRTSISGIIHKLEVGRDNKRQGIGTRLVRVAISEALDRSAEVVYVIPGASDPAESDIAREFYDALGFSSED